MVKNPTIGIIGGTGLMGQLFKNFFKDEGYNVLIAGRKTELSMENLAKQCDVVIISVPIDSSIEIIKKIGPLVKEQGLLMDLTSIKVEPLEAMLTHSKCSVVGTHPVFGPGLKTINNQTIVLCPGRGEEWLKWLENLFAKNKAKIKICSAQEHDKMMAVIQGLIHFTSITISHVLKELNIDIEDSMSFSSPIYKLRLDMVGRILNQDPNLYANIEIKNPEVPNVLDVYIKTCNKLLTIIKDKSMDKFIDFFNEAADYLGDFKKEAEEYSDYIIKMLVK